MAGFGCRPRPQRPALRVTDDNPLVEFADESGSDGKATTTGEAQDGLVSQFVVASDHIGHAVPFLADEVGRTDPSQDNVTRESASWKRC